VVNHPQAEKTSEVDEGLETPQIVARAADLTRYIVYSDPHRFAHSQAVARRAEFLALAVEPASASLLVAAAWLHDIGYAPRLRDTGYHPIDGSRHLKSIG
jgi:HD superfamily phosphodiesterase